MNKGSNHKEKVIRSEYANKHFDEKENEIDVGNEINEMQASRR